MRRDARRWLELSAKTPSEVRSEARALWAEVAASMGVDSTEPKTFDEAFQAGAEAIQAMVALDVQIESATGAEREKLTTQRAESRDAAYNALAAAVKLADEDTDPSKRPSPATRWPGLDWDGGRSAARGRA